MKFDEQHWLKINFCFDLSMKRLLCKASTIKVIINPCHTIQSETKSIIIWLVFTNVCKALQLKFLLI